MIRTGNKGLTKYAMWPKSTSSKFSQITPMTPSKNDPRPPKKKISYIFLYGLYKKIFFSGHFDEIFISKVNLCKF